MKVAANYQPIFRELGIDADAVFEHELIVPWRSLPDRENCLLDTTLRDGARVRWHIKRYRAGRTFAMDESRAFELLAEHGIPTATMIAAHVMEDGRSFIITEDLAGYDD